MIAGRAPTEDMHGVRATAAVWTLFLAGCVGPPITAERAAGVEAALNELRADAPDGYPALSEAPAAPADLPPPAWFHELAEALRGRASPLEAGTSDTQDQIQAESKPESERDGQP